MTVPPAKVAEGNPRDEVAPPDTEPPDTGPPEPDDDGGSGRGSDPGSSGSSGSSDADDADDSDESGDDD